MRLERSPDLNAETNPSMGSFHEPSFNLPSTLDEPLELRADTLYSNRPQFAYSEAPGGGRVKYFLGEETVVGSDYPIRPHSMSVVRLDRSTAAIALHAYGKTNDQVQVAYTFDLLTPEEVKEKTPTASDFAETEQPALEVTEEEMRSRIKEYDVTQVITRHRGEPEQAYTDRVAKLNGMGLHMKPVRSFFGRLGVSLQDLSWPEQLIIANAFLEVDHGQMEKFAGTYGLTGVRAFLSADYDANLGSGILSLGGKLEPESARAIFAKYSELADAAQYVGSYLERYFKTSLDFNGKLRLQDFLLSRAKELLASANEHSQNVDVDPVAVKEFLETQKTEVLSFAACVKLLPKGAKLDLSGIKETVEETKTLAELTDEEKSQMTAIFKANRLESYPSELMKLTVEEFQKILAGQDKDLSGTTRNFRMIKHQGQLAAFLHYDESSAGDIYVGSLNLSPAAKDSPIAVYMIRKALAEFPDRDLSAIVYEHNPAREFYVKFLGFQEQGIEDRAGFKYVKLLRPKLVKPKV